MSAEALSSGAAPRPDAASSGEGGRPAAASYGAAPRSGAALRLDAIPRLDAVVEVAAPAKVNLSLLVGPLRSDGFHEVFTAMVPVTLGDLVTARPAPAGAGLTVECAVAPGEDNLAARAVRELERRLERTFDVRLSITKRVPAAAGLGGGSSDAAAALTAVERLFALELPVRLCYEVAGAVGSDVPFFLWPGPQLAMGRGTVLKEIDLPEPLHVVIALPDVALSTADVYRWFSEHPASEPKVFVERTQRLVGGLAAARRPRDLAPLIENDLEAPVVARHPLIADLGRRLRAAGALAAVMSGSGSSVFGLFASAARAQRACAALAPTAAVYVTDLRPGGDPSGSSRPSRPGSPPAK